MTVSLRAQGTLLPCERPLVDLVTAEEEQEGLVVSFVGTRERTENKACENEKNGKEQPSPSHFPPA